MASLCYGSKKRGDAKKTRNHLNRSSEQQGNSSKQAAKQENKQVCIKRFECGIDKIEYNIIFELVIIIIGSKWEGVECLFIF